MVMYPVLVLAGRRTQPAGDAVTCAAVGKNTHRAGRAGDGAGVGAPRKRLLSSLLVISANQAGLSATVCS